MPILPPPGLGFDLVEMSINETETEGEGGANAMTSTPYRDKGKGKERELDVPKKNLAPTGVDETIFHAKEKAPRLPPALHDRSNSFSLGQTMFYSMAHADSKRSSTSSAVADYPAYPSSAKSSPMSANDSAPASRTSSPGIKGRGRSLSDTAFMSMLRSPSPRLPEADINDESSSDLVVYSSAKEAKPEPDPFSATANTYYTPQTMIPATPPGGDSAAGAGGHGHKVSKEEDIIFSLKTQLALQSELCGQFETDLRARDELVEVLGKKLGEVEREEAKKRNTLKQWKKKVMELERACRYLEEEVEGSRQESMERSIMDEASSEALRMLHRQIAGLEREKESWKRMEEMLREEMGTLEVLLREKSDDVMKLKETLWSRDESERELKQGIQDAKREMEMMGNLSIGLIDENELKNELKKMTMVKDQRDEEERERHREAEFAWEDEKEELLAAVENAKLENAGLVAELDNYKEQLKDHDEELTMLKSELEAQWDHTEKGAEKVAAAEAAKRAAETERDTLQVKINELEEKMTEMDAEYVESENKQFELENDIQELWDVKEALEKEREEVHLPPFFFPSAC
jgi:septal ring factor EnvC (AmiA/AmiB activator)